MNLIYGTVYLIIKEGFMRTEQQMYKIILDMAQQDTRF